MEYQDSVVWNEVFLSLDVSRSDHSREKRQTEKVICAINLRLIFIYFRVYYDLIMSGYSDDR
jgi:hypothetical protein